MNKRGQFFLIAALIIVGILVTLTTINISTKTSETKNAAIYDLSKEAKYEGAQVFNYGVFSESQEQIAPLIASLMANYSLENPDTDFTILYGDKSSLKRRDYTSSVSGTVGLNTGGSSSEIPIETVTPSETNVPKSDIIGNNVRVKIGTETLNFELQEGQNFFIVLKKESGGETLVAQE